MTAMTICATEPATTRRVGFTFAADGSYAACLANTPNGGWIPERWTMGGPEPYTVPLPGREPEELGSRLLPLTDGRVLICRRAEGGYEFALLYPTEPGTAELPMGSLPLDEVRLLPLPALGPCPSDAAWHTGPALAFALGCAKGEDDQWTTSVWLITTCGDSPAPDLLAALPGRHTGGVWLDREGRLLAMDKAADGRIKTVVLDLESGRTTPLLQIAPESNDQLLLADPDSGLLVVRSDAPGTERLGWGVLGSERPIRFPSCVRLPDAVATPFAVQPGAALTPEDCGVALRVDGPGGSWLALWRPALQRIDPLPVPDGWLVGTGHWSSDGLRLPYATGHCPFGVANVATEPAEAGESGNAAADPEADKAAADDPPAPADAPSGTLTLKPVPLQQAPLGNSGARKTEGNIAHSSK